MSVGEFLGLSLLWYFGENEARKVGSNSCSIRRGSTGFAENHIMVNTGAA